MALLGPWRGKSTLIGAYITVLRRTGKTVGVVAVDPSSPVTGGSILGDRIRMSVHGGDDGVFIRSLSSKGHLGGLSRTAARVVDVMDSAGLDVILVETVGTGQSEIEIMDLAQTTVVVCAPGLGDEIQALKAGILEIAHVLVVNKSDLSHAALTAAQLSDAMTLSHDAAWIVPVVRTNAVSGEGLDDMADAIAAHRGQLTARQREEAGKRRIRKLLANTAAEQLNGWVEQLDDRALDALCDAVRRGEQGLEEAGAALWRLMADRLHG